MLTIGITGTLAAGKGTVVEYLKKKGFRHFSVRAFLTEEIKKRGLEVNRDSMVAVANELRANFGNSYIVEQLYYQALEVGENCVIESIRNLGEVQFLRNTGNFILLSIDADPNLRYQRINDRRSETDKISFERFIADEKREMTPVNPNEQDLSGCMKAADSFFSNNSTLEAVEEWIDDVLWVSENGFLG